MLAIFGANVINMTMANSAAPAPTQIAAAEFHQRRRILLPAQALDRQHPDLVAGPAHQHGLDLVMAEKMTAERPVPRQHRHAAMRDEWRKADDGVMAPIGSAIALPPGGAQSVGAHAEPHAELEYAREHAGRWHPDNQRLQDAEGRVGLCD